MIKSSITITADEAFAAGTVGILRQIRAVTKNRNSDHGNRNGNRPQRDRWANHIHGAMAEIALAKAINRAWTPGGAAISNGDVGDQYEVRATEMNNERTCLYIYNTDLDTKWYILVIGHFPDFTIEGGVRGIDGKNPDWWNAQANPPCFYVPRSHLIPINEIFINGY